MQPFSNQYKNYHQLDKQVIWNSVDGGFKATLTISVK